VEEEWSSYPSSGPNNVTHKFLWIPLLILLTMILYVI
jgi:hypothetical protein